MSEAMTPEQQSKFGFKIIDGVLAVGDVALDRLAARIGSTPFFAYDRRLISERVDALRQYLPADVELSYAVKANPMPAVVQLLAGLVDGFDVASAGELKTALDTTMAPERVSFAGPGKRVHELKQALAAGVVINVESVSELERLVALGVDLGIVPRVCLRINPNFDLRAAGMRMGGGAKQFGIDSEEVPVVLDRLKDLRAEFFGFQIFAGSQNLNAEAICATQEQTVELAVALSKRAASPVRHLNIGGGFGIPYFPNDKPLDLQVIGESLEKQMKRVRRELQQARVVLELGRYLVGEAGIYVCRVVDRKISRGRVFLVTDGGLHHHLAASGNFGQVVRRNFPVAIGNRLASDQQETVSVVGCLCTPLDLLAENVALPAAQEGDYVVIFQSGAYAMTASPHDFLGHPPPVEVLV